jgi:hypothetical protein
MACGMSGLAAFRHVDSNVLKKEAAQSLFYK